MSKYYTFVGEIDGNIYHRYIENGERHIDIVKMYPYEIFLKDGNGDYNSLYSEKLTRYEFDTIPALKKFIYDSGRDNIYGNTSPVQQFIASEYPDEIKMSELLYVIFNFDLEVEHEHSFPEPKLANNEILSVSYEVRVGKGESKQFYMGTLPYTGKDKKTIIKIFDNERDLIKGFIGAINEHQPDFMTNWYGDVFDIPYLVHRTIKVLGKEIANTISPFGKYSKKCITENKYSPFFSFNIFGITNLDYMELYKKYSPDKQESYRLDHIAEVEIGENKIKFPEYKNNLMNLYLGRYDIAPETKKETLNEKDRWCRLRTILKNKLDIKYV